MCNGGGVRNLRNENDLTQDIQIAICFKITNYIRDRLF